MIAPGLPEDEEYLAALRRRARCVARGRGAGRRDAVIDLVSYAPEDYGDARVASPLNAAGDGPGTHQRDGRAERPRTSSASRGCSPTGRCAVPIQATYELDARPRRCRRWPPPTPRERRAIAVG